MKRHVKLFEDFSVNDARSKKTGLAYIVTYDGPPPHAPDAAGPGEEIIVSVHPDMRSARRSVKEDASTMARESRSAFGGSLREFMDIFEPGFDIKEVDPSDPNSVRDAFRLVLSTHKFGEEEASEDALNHLLGLDADVNLILDVADLEDVRDFFGGINVNGLPETARAKITALMRNRG